MFGCKVHNKKAISSHEQGKTQIKQQTLPDAIFKVHGSHLAMNVALLI
jgi:hypothetical protein